jgi:hypothetical protein
MKINNIEGEVVKDNTDLKSLVLSSTLLYSTQGEAL